MCDFIVWCKLTPSEQAAWVQAVGSVVAILIAIAIAVPAMAACYSSRKERARSRERMLNAAIRILDPISSLRVSLGEYYETSAPDYDPADPIVSIDPHEGDFQALIPAVISSVSVLDDMGPLAPALRKFLFEIIDLDRFLKMIPALQRSGAHSSWINNRDDIRDQAKGAMNSADLVINGMRDLMSQGK